MNKEKEARNMVRSVCPSLIRNEDLINDVMQAIIMIEIGFKFDNFTKVYNGTGTLRGYKYYMCKNLILNYMNRHRSYKRISPTIQNNLFYNDSSYKLVLECLSDRESDIVEKYYIYNYTLQEIGNQYGYSDEWIGQIIKKAKNKIKENYELD